MKNMCHIFATLVSNLLRTKGTIIRFFGFEWLLKWIMVAKVTNKISEHTNHQPSFKMGVLVVRNGIVMS